MSTPNSKSEQQEISEFIYDIQHFDQPYTGVVSSSSEYPSKQYTGDTSAWKSDTAYKNHDSKFLQFLGEYKQAVQQEQQDISELITELDDIDSYNPEVLNIIGGSPFDNSKSSLKQGNNFINELATASSMLKDNHESIKQSVKDRNSRYKGTINQHLNLTDNIYNVDNSINEEHSYIEQNKAKFNTKLRKAELSEYNNLKYYAYIEVCKVIIAVIVAILFFVGLLQMQLVPSSIGHILLALTIIIGGYFIIQSLVNIYYRDNMNYNEYTWDWNSSYTDIDNSPPEDIFSYGLNKSFIQSEENNVLSDSGTCIGQECCNDSTFYNSTTNKCEATPKATPKSTTK